MSSPNANETRVFSNSPITISVLVSNNGCTNTATRTIGVDTFLQILDFSNDTIVCAGSDIPLVVTAISDTATRRAVSCSHYDVTSIAYNRVSGSGVNVTFYDPTYTTIDEDNGFSRALPIRFNFPFYCNVYDSLYISANGYVTFTKPISGASLPQTIPDNSLDNNLIAVNWDDYDISLGGNVDYRTIGTAPNRRMIINFEDIESVIGGSYRGQLILNEADSSITINHNEVSNDGNTTCGVEDIDGIDATEAPGRNNTYWNISTREAWKFKPAIVFDSARILSYYWVPNTYMSDPYSSNTYATVMNNTSYVVNVSDGFCVDQAIINASIIPTPIPAIIGIDTICLGDSTALTASGGLSYVWSTGDTTATIQVAPTNATGYFVWALNSNDCISFNGVNVEVNTFSSGPVSVEATPDYGCIGAPITLNASGHFVGTGAIPTWYTDSLGMGTLVGIGDTINTALTSNIYYMRLDGVCNAVESSVNTNLGASLNVILATDPNTNSINYCDEGAWTYYEHPNIPNKYIFAIKWGLTNDTIKSLATVSISNENATIFSEASRSGGLKDASYLMKRYWNVDVGTSILNEPVAIKFYYDTTEIISIFNERDTHLVSLNAITPATYFDVPIKWFKTVGLSFDPSMINDGNNFSFPFVELNPVDVGKENGINYVQFDSILSFSGGTAGVGITPYSGITLPVKFINIQAIPVNNSFIKIRWSTLSEINNKGFELFRSIDGIHFEKISFINGHTNSTTLYDYYYDDKSVSKEQVYYYKIKQIDLDNQEYFTKIVSASLTDNDHIKIGEFYPNPSNDNSTINITVTNNCLASLELYNVLSQKVIQLDSKLLIGTNTISLNTSQLSAGVYLANIKIGVNNFYKYVYILK